MTARETSEQIRQETKQRLVPSITNPNWLILRARRKLFTSWVAGMSGDSLRVLDVGGRIQPYRPLFGNRVREYYSLDLVTGPCVSVLGSAESLPVGAGLFDVVICTQMLEYVPCPQKALDEIHRVLRPGGYLFLSVPAVFIRDSDPEYWRFLPSALRLLLRDFSEVEIAAEGSSISGLLRTLNVFLVAFAPPIVKSILRYTVVPALNVVGVVAEGLVRTTNDQFTANFSAMARK